ncbi:hypothetical protein AUEXF2481DRAFT_432976 [Aureobasidium subglaciale EXF-2481]|uniref:AB hydrolase-1 domain-containing protein n=1 Tax=Aureobasidium subglaciale (strain EXF-2481) TaxID=1043005 RepID=A0A074Y373_AURSE|nr:uncharacterized protein AUEXF2481DRAFT_432976 [Aureobasidium subglaciale EXF-2481]KEQ92145.1 hypothetical protein AUEXF2481DRAFT_432976 [Aureobasidium subglaciale EXF-2481]
MTTSTPPQPPSSPFDAATAFSSQSCFHQSITLPATADHEALKVTYATTTNFSNEGLPTILFCHPMGAARYLIYEFEHLATTTGVRVLIIDRPGFGASTPVELSKRVDVFLDAVTAVLENLRVKTVALMSHSAGTIYLANVLIRLSQFLHPEWPFAGVMTPWIHPKFSNAGLMQVVNKLPSSWIGKYHHIQSFVAGSIAPSLQLSSAMLGLKSSGLTETESVKWHGMDKQTWDQVSTLQGKWSRLEDMSGISADCLFCLQEDGKDWGDYANLSELISTLQQTYPKGTRQLTMQAYFAETDVIVGKGGQKYFERCWREGNAGQEVKFQARVVEGSDHDNIPLAEKGCIGEMFKEIKRLNG